jgi:hypothetical protein
MEMARDRGIQAHRPSFLITIDAEGDSEWAHPNEITTHNSRFLPRFQALCERYGLRPTYLTNYDMARCPHFREFGRGVVSKGTAEIGMHLHAWSSPPLVPLTQDDLKHHPYLIEYPDAVMQAKVDQLTTLLEETFCVEVLSHRAGRWAFDTRYARILAARGYLVDCSVTPYLSWRHHKGVPDGRGGSDYRRFPDAAYFLDLDDIGRSGDSTLLEVPMSIVPARRPLAKLWRYAFSNGSRPVRALGSRLFPVHWLRPIGGNVDRMLAILRTACQVGRDYVEFMLHSSEMMPGGSPRFRTETDIDALYSDMEQVFEVAAQAFRGLTLTEYYRSVAARRRSDLLRRRPRAATTLQ